MKPFVFLSVSLLTICLHVLAASTDSSISSKAWENSYQNLRVINIYNLTEQDLTKILQGDCPEIAVEFTAQTTLPITFFLTGEFLNLVQSEEQFGTIEIKQSFYIRCVGQELIFSTSLTDWKPFLEFLTGNASVGFSNQNGQPLITVGAEANRRS